MTMRSWAKGSRRVLACGVVPVLASVLGCEDGGGEKSRDLGSAERDAQAEASAQRDADTEEADAGAGADEDNRLSTPSNIAPEEIGAEAGDVVLKGDRCILDTTQGEISACFSGSQFDGLIHSRIRIAGSDREAALFVVKSLRLEPGAKLHVVGNVPAIIYAHETIEIEGTMDGDGSTRLPAGAPDSDADGHGGGDGGGEAYRQTSAAGGGGSFCGVGGKGASFDAEVSARAAGVAYGKPELTPLVAGSGGGGTGGMHPSGGVGGPAIQLSAGISITVDSVGAINVGGQGGGASAGGGSGGALLLEAPLVSIRGGLFANGAAGGLSYDNSNGQDGQSSATRAQGKEPTAGKGSGAGDINGTDGTTSSMRRETGGGGGGAGRIRINTRSGAADIADAAVISPALDSVCVTQGKL